VGKALDGNLKVPSIDMATNVDSCMGSGIDDSITGAWMCDASRELTLTEAACFVARE